MEPIVIGVWGFCGSVPYAGTRLVTALWGNAEVDARIRKLAIANFVIAMFTGPAAAVAFAPWMVEHARGANVGSVAITVGLLSNVVWPMVTDKGFLKPAVASFLGYWGKLFTDAAQKAGAKANDV